VSLIGETFVRVRPDTSLFRVETQAGIGAALTGLGVGGAAGSALRLAGPVAAIAAIGIAAREAIGGAASLEEELNVFQVIAQATEEQMAAVADEAIRLGADLSLPAVSAADAGQAMTELARGGLEVTDVLGGTKGVLQLAAAGELAVAEAAQVAARALTTFRLPGEEAANVANLLVGAANAATGEVTDMALALQQSGAVAAQVGLSIEDTVTAISLLAKNGIIGSDAGTSLRTTLLRLIPTTKEAGEVVEALGINVADAEGDLRPLSAIFDDYRVALNRLTPVLRQEALTQIFGTDAIRAASVFSQEGAAGFAALEEALTREGQAAETAAARAEGLSGATRGLGSQLETLATNVGELALPALTELGEGASDVVGGINAAVVAFKDLGEAEFPVIGEGNADDLGAFGDALGFVRQQWDALGRTQVPADLLKELDELDEALFGVSLGLGNLIDQAAEPITFDFSATAQLIAPVQDAAVRELSFEGALAEKLRRVKDSAGKQGYAIGAEIGEEITAGIISAEQEAVNAARKTLARVIEEGQDAVAEAIRQGREAVRLSAIDARTNLIAIGRDLAADAVALIDEGPLARRIDQLRDQLDRSSAGNERRRLQETLRDAQRELRVAQENVQVAGPTTAAQRAAQQRFLEPFRRNVKDAKAALGEFTTEGVIDRLQEQADTQKRVVQQGIADLIVQFNQGGISLSDLNQRIAQLLERNGVEPYGRAGRRLGIAFRAEWMAQFKAMVQQAREIVAGIDVPQIGLEPRVVSPRGERLTQDQVIARTREQAAAREQGARDALRRSNLALQRAVEDNTDASTDLPDRIVRALRSSPARRGARTGDDATTGVQR
jgi:TP901 family phage tail tape measure protein